jgi:hypothetical protein
MLLFIFDLIVSATSRYSWATPLALALSKICYSLATPSLVATLVSMLSISNLKSLSAFNLYISFWAKSITFWSMLIGEASFYNLKHTFEHFLDVIDWLQNNAIIIDFAEALDVFDDLVLNSQFMSNSKRLLQKSNFELDVFFFVFFNGFLELFLVVNLNRVFQFILNFPTAFPAICAPSVNFFFLGGIQISEHPLHFIVTFGIKVSADPAPILDVLLFKGMLWYCALLGWFVFWYQP